MDKNTGNGKGKILTVFLSRDDFGKISEYIKSCGYRRYEERHGLSGKDWEMYLDSVYIPELKKETLRPRLCFHLEKEFGEVFLECEFYLDNCECEGIDCRKGPEGLLNWEIELPEDEFGYSLLRFELSSSGMRFAESLEYEEKKYKEKDMKKMRKEDKQFAKKVYGLYQLRWMAEHGWTLENLVKTVGRIASETIEYDPSLIPTDEQKMQALIKDVKSSFLHDAGFNGELFVCFDEFLEAEFLDAGYIAELLSVLPDAEKNIAKWRRLTEIEDSGLELSGMMTISTAHVCSYTAELLDKDAIDDVIVYQKDTRPWRGETDPCCCENYGWWISIPSDDVTEGLPELKGRIPDDLLDCMVLAQKNNCRWICLDRDADTTPLLHEYDW